MRELVFRRFQAGDGAIVGAWRYPPPYDVYNDDHEIVDDPSAASIADDHFAILDGGEMIGFCSFGADARVPGGDYPDGPLDVGLGLRPDLAGRGHGAEFLSAILAFAARELGATSFRATVAEFNARALRLVERAGFRRLSRFDGRDRAFWILVR